MTYTRAMAKELGPQGIRVNAVCPGLIGTSFHDIFSKPEGRAATAGNTPLRREGHPDEVADTIVYLASPAASFPAGVCLDINGGLRSEEHTSELQSLMRISYAVFCLKKKTYITYTQSTKQ